MVFGTTVTRGELQTDLASWLRPPKKWSYLKLFGWSVVVSFVALIVYVHSVMQSSGMASSLPVRLYVLIPTMIFFVLLMLFGWHNYAFLDNMAWDRSFVCKRCGAVWESWCGFAVPKPGE